MPRGFEGDQVHVREPLGWGARRDFLPAWEPSNWLSPACNQNEDLIFFVTKFFQITFKLTSGTHGGLLNHVEKKLIQNSNSIMVSRLSTMVATLLFMIFGTLISSTLPNCYKFFFTWFSMPAWVSDRVFKVMWSNYIKSFVRFSFWILPILQCFLQNRAPAEACVRRRGSSRPRGSTCWVFD